MLYIALLNNKKEMERGELKLDNSGDIPGSIMCKSGLYYYQEVWRNPENSRLTVMYNFNIKKKK